MDFEIPFLSRMRVSPIPELSATEAMKYLEKRHNAARRSDTIKVAGTVGSPVQNRMQGQVSFDVESDGIPLKVSVPEQDALAIVPGVRVVIEGRLLIEAANSSLFPILKGHIVQQGRACRVSELQRKFPSLALADFLAHKLDLVILGSERAIHDLDEQLKNKNCYPGPFRREIVRMMSSVDVLAAVRRYNAIAQGILFVRRGGEASEFQFWSDPGFIEELLESKLHIYIGLGHAEHRTALDNFADQQFPTPIAAGIALSEFLLNPRKIDKEFEPEPKAADAPSVSLADEHSPAKQEYYPSNAFIWTLALSLGALVLILGLW